RRAHTVSMQPTSNAAGRDGSALRMLKLFRDRPLLVGDVRTGTIPSLLSSQKHYLKVYSWLKQIASDCWLSLHSSQPTIYELDGSEFTVHSSKFNREPGTSSSNSM
ncbi:MAG: hypothetical protein V1736_13805, partial [Pseudomonadota bacterium]